MERLPTPGEYLTLRRAVGWEPLPEEMARQGLAGSLWCVVAELAGTIVGIARIVGDGAVYFYLQDVIVLPEHQGRGIGGRLMEAALTWLKEHCSAGALVGLMAAQGAAPFYARYGFRPRPPEAPGMYLPWPPGAAPG